MNEQRLYQLKSELDAAMNKDQSIWAQNRFE